MDEKLGYLTAFLATVPALGLQCFGISIFSYSEVEDRFTTQFTPDNSQEEKEVLETRIERMARVAEKDLEKIQYWLNQYKIYKIESDYRNALSNK